MHRAISFLLSLLVVLSLSGCRTFVELNSDRYVPNMPDTIRGYQETQLFLQGFENRANDTTIFYYYSPSSGASYGGPVLASYLWYSFQKALLRLGIHVYDSAPGVPVPEMRLAFSSWSDQHFVCDVQLLFPGQAPLAKRYDLAFSDPGEDPDHMELRAYRQVDQIVGRIFGDPEFGAAFLRGQPRWPAQPPALFPPPPVPSPPSPAPSGLAPPEKNPVQAQPTVKAHGVVPDARGGATGRCPRGGGRPHGVVPDPTGWCPTGWCPHGVVPDASAPTGWCQTLPESFLRPQGGVGFRMVHNFFPWLPTTRHATTAALRP